MKKNKVFQNKINKRLNNNQKVSKVIEDMNNDLSVNEGNETENIKVKEIIDKLLNRNGYIFNVDVEIVTDNKKYDTRIAGKVNNHIITLDNDIICIDKIKDIIVKE